MTRLLIVDDDVTVTADLRHKLEEQGYWVDVATTLPKEMTAGGATEYALVIVDVSTPRVGGFDALRHMRRQSMLPVMILTARGDETDRVTGLELGADDYITKPCGPREVIARIRAILRRTLSHGASDPVDGVLRSGRLSMWPAERKAEWEGEPLKLTSTEFSLLEILLRAVGRPVSKAELSRRALGRPPARYARSIDVHLSSVRRKLGVLADGRPLIQAVHLHGYQLLKE